MKASASLIIALVSTGLLASCTKPAVTIDNAWIRTPPPGMSMTAAYLTLHNKTAETITLVGATSEAFEQVTIHESRVVDGISEMIRLRSLSIAAGERLVFQPGGLHLMMTKPKQAVARGDNTTITLQLADQTRVPASAVVSDQAP